MTTRSATQVATAFSLFVLVSTAPVFPALAEVQVEINKSWACCVDESLEKNTTLIKLRNSKETPIATLIKRTKKKIANKRSPAAKRKKLRALLRLVRQCKKQKGDFQPGETPAPKTGSAFAKADLIPTGNGVAAKCNLVIPDSEAVQTRAVTGGSIYCSLGGVVTAGSYSFFLFGNNPTVSEALTNITIIPINGQFNNISVDLDAATATSASDFLRGSDTTLSGDLSYTSSGQTFTLMGDFEETSGEGDCMVRASIQGQGNSGQVTLDLADGLITVVLGDEVSSLTNLNIFAGSTANSPTVGQFAIPQSIIDTLPQSEFSFSLSTEELAQVVNAVANVSQTLTVSIPQSPVDNTLVGTFATPQTDCPAAQ